MNIVGFFQVLVILISPALCVILGERVLATVLGLFKVDYDSEIALKESQASLLVLGLLVHIVSVFVLKCIGLPWVVAFFLPLIPVLFRLRELGVLVFEFRPKLSLNFLLWLFVVLATGISLFSYGKGISTAWENNYGDLTFHMGMISSFVFGENFPPEYHIFPGRALSYPFLVNVWSAMLWWPQPTLSMLSFIFLFQWVVLWWLVFHFLKGNRYWILPWALLLGGGSFFQVFADPPAYSWKMLGKGYPWTVFISTVWVTQRTALFGVVCGLSGLFSWFAAKDAKSTDAIPWALILSGLTLGLAPLAHTHIFLFITLFCGGVIFASAVWEKVRAGTLFGQDNDPDREESWNFKHVLVFGCALLPSLCFLPFLLGKAGMVKLMFGWTEPYPIGADWFTQIKASAHMWITNAPAWFAFMLLLYLLVMRHIEMAVLVTLFLLGNVVRLNDWSWDQLKVFIAIYVVFLALYAHSKNRQAYRAHFMCVLLIVPGVVECYRLFLQGPDFNVYSTSKVAQAEYIREHTSSDAIIAAAPKHHSAVTLTGRMLYFGYVGTLNSHKVDFEERQKIARQLDLIANCAEHAPKNEAQYCPDYLLWGAEEKNYFKRPTPGDGFVRSGVDYLYEIRKTKG